MAAFMILSHRLNIQEFAELSYFHLALGYVAAFATLGLGVTTVRTFATVGSTRLAYEAGAELTVFIILAALAFMGALLWGEPTISGLPSWTFAAVLPLLIISGFPQGLLSGRQEFRSIAAAAILGSMVVVICSALATGDRALLIALAGLAGGYLVKFIVEAVMSTAAIRRAAVSIRWPSSNDLRKVVAAMSWLGTAGIANAVGMWALASWMRSSLDDAVFGTFAIGLQWYAIGMFVAANITRVLMPVQVEMASGAKDAWDKRRLIILGGGAAVGATAGVAICAFLLRNAIASFYDVDLAGLNTAIAAFAAAAATAAPLNIIGNFAVAEGKEKVWTLSAIAWLVFVAAGALASAGLGAIGAACALAIGNVAQCSMVLALLHREGLL